ncbi:hypothetical protein HYT25_03885 [Candidatus Pacearchaeota archaeon]|nr:hypothetical protein [Candidatus Pacearchaeota archaeon]
MGVLDQVMQMRNQGIDDEEIVRTLQEGGIAPKAISDALGQAQIKQAVSDEYTPPEPGFQEQQYTPKAQDESGFQEGGYQPYQQQQYTPQQGYEESYVPGGLDTSTVIEISEQVFNEKIQKMQKQLKEVSDFKSLAEGKIESMTEKLKRLEHLMDTLQIQILEKVGSYGRKLEQTEKEMEMMQDSFSKVVPSLVGKHTPHHAKREEHATHSGKKKHHKR